MKPITSFAIGAATFSALQILWGLGHAYGRLRGPWIMKTGSGIGFCFAVFVVITAVVCAYYRKPNGLAKCVGAIALGAIASMTGALFLIVANRHSLRWRNYRSGRCRRRSNWRSVSWSEQCLTTRSRRPTGVKAGVNEQFANEWAETSRPPRDYFGERVSACVLTSRLCLSTTRCNSRSIVLNASWITLLSGLCVPLSICLSSATSS